MGILFIVIGVLVLSALTSMPSEGHIKDSSWRVWPSVPTDLDLVEVCLGEPVGEAVQALKVSDAPIFYCLVPQGALPASRYRLGVLAPGDYTFFVYEQDKTGCAFEPLMQLSFTVRRACSSHVNYEQGFVTLLVEVHEREEVDFLIRLTKPVFTPVLENWWEVRVIPGLEWAYIPLISKWPLVVGVDLDRPGYIPECPPPFGDATRPGRLLVKLSEAVTNEEFETMVKELPPVLVLWHSGWFDENQDIGKAVVKVPLGLETFFLRWFLEMDRVHGGALGNVEVLMWK